MGAVEDRDEARVWPRVAVVVLRPGGKLVVTTPNFRSLGAHVFGEYWRGLEVPRHLFLTPQALRACSEAAGLDIQDLRKTANIASYIWANSSQIKRDAGGLHDEPSIRLRVEGLAFHAAEYGLCWGGRQEGKELVMEATRYH